MRATGHPAPGEEHDDGTAQPQEGPEVGVIDLAGAEGTDPQWGSPCPAPPATGVATSTTSIPFKEIMFLHCTECAHKYEITKAEIGIDGLAATPSPPDVAAPIA